MNDLLLRRPDNGAYKLALRFPGGALKGAGAALAAAMGEDGRLVPLVATGPGGPGSSVVSAIWRFENILQDEEGGLVIGPDFEGKPKQMGLVLSFFSSPWNGNTCPALLVSAKPIIPCRNRPLSKTSASPRAANRSPTLPCRSNRPIRPNGSISPCPKI